MAAARHAPRPRRNPRATTADVYGPGSVVVTRTMRNHPTAPSDQQPNPDRARVAGKMRRRYLSPEHALAAALAR